MPSTPRLRIQVQPLTAPLLSTATLARCFACTAALLLLAFAAGAQTSPASSTIIVDGIDSNPLTSTQPITTDLGGGNTNFEVGEVHGWRPGGGVNLMQSFEQIDLKTGDILDFTAGLPTDRVIVRVQPTAASNVWGTVRNSVVGADLFLLNSAGWVIGETAAIDVTGSFHLSTADTLWMDDGGAVLLDAFTGNAALATALPSAFGFATAPVGEISINGATLRPDDGSGISLVGGNVLIDNTGATSDGSVTTSGAPLQIVSLSGAGDVSIDAVTGVLSAPTDTSLGHVLVRDATPDGLSDVGSAGSGAFLSGDVSIESGSLEIDGALVLAEATTGVLGDVQGNVTVSADRITMRSGAELGTRTILRTGGDVDIRTNGQSGFATSGLAMSDRSIIEADAPIGGTGGDLFIGGFDTVDLSGRSEIRSDAYGFSSATGNVTLDVGTIRLVERSEISAGAFQGANQGPAPPGDVTITADSIELLSGGSIESISVNSGDGGNVTINAGSILIDGAFIDQGLTNNLSQPSSISSTAVYLDCCLTPQAGSISINAPKITLSNGGRIAAEAVAGGMGGNIDIQTQHLEVSGFNTELAGVLGLLGLPENATTGSSLFVNLTRDPSFARSSIAASAIVTDEVDGSGNVIGSFDLGATAGSVNIGSLGNIGALVRVDGGSIAASSEGSGGSGDVTLDIGRLALRRGGEVTVSATGGADAGNIFVDASRSISVDHSTITTASAFGTGGQITLASAGLIDVTRGEVTTRVATGTGGGGDLSITAPQIALNGANVIAQADAGNGGNIQITANQLVQSIDTVVDASANAGVDGVVTFAAPEVNVEGGISGLATPFFDASGLVRPSCEAIAERGDNERGQFVVSNQPAYADDPDELFASLGEVLRPMSEQDGQQDETLLAMNDASVPTRGALGRSMNDLRNDAEEARNAGDLRGEAQALARLGSAEVALGRGDTAIATLERGLKVAIDSGATEAALTMWNDLGNQHSARDDVDAAIDAYLQSAVLADELGRNAQALRSLANAGRAAADEGRVKRGRDILGRARARTLAGPASDSIRLHLARSYQLMSLAAKDPALLTPAFELLRLVIDRIDAEETPAPEDARSLAFALGTLGSLYEQQGRTTEALFLTRKAVEASETIAPNQSSAGLYRLHWQEGRLLAHNNSARDAVASYRRAVALLEETRQETLARHGAAASHFRQAIAPVYLDLVDSLLQLSEGGAVASREGLLHEARGTVELLKAAELRDYFQDECIAELASKETSLDSVSSTAAIVYPILLPGRAELLVSIAGRLERYRVAVPSRDVETSARALRTALQKTSGVSHIAPAQQLYTWLVAPYRERLRAANVDTLVIVPDGALRSIPLAALHDGEKFLIEEFAVAVTPSLALVDPQPVNAENARIVAAGISDGVQGFPALAGVREELSAVGEMYGAEVLLNGEFSAGSVSRAIAEQRPTIVHIASHGIFSGDPETSFLLTHEGRLTMNQLAEAVGVTRFRDDEALELLILSACETAAGDDRSALGLAGVAIKAGARSAMGSLWSISDDAAYEMIIEFHRQIRSGEVSKARALQVAQQRLLKDPKLAHPFYWSPFLLISNWL